MEKERIKRMRGGAVNDDDEELPGTSGPKGGFAARRAKAQAASEGMMSVTVNSMLTSFLGLYISNTHYL